MSQSHDYIPQTDDGLLIFSKNFYPYALSNYSHWQVPSPEALLSSPTAAYESALEVQHNPNHGKVDTLIKNEAKKLLKSALRIYIQGFVMRNPYVTDQDRQKMGLPLRDLKATLHPAPDMKPETEVNPSGKGQHTVTAINPHAGNKQKPPLAKGVSFAFRLRGMEEPKAHASDMPSEFQTVTVKVFQWQETDCGKVCDYATAYESSSGKRGPWSDVVSLIIA